jgi:hypothetical protein
MTEDGKEKPINWQYYEKLADWGERFALLVFGSLVVQQLTEGASRLVIGTGIVITAASYIFAYQKLKRIK